MTAAVPVTDTGAGRPADAILAGLRVPVVAAPMLIVSGPGLVIAACRAGVLGSFPTANPRGEGELEQWLKQIEAALAAIVSHAPAAVITSVGSPAAVIPALHDAGIQVWSDVASVRHAERAI